MVYAGLRNVVSENADQAGSENSPSRLRLTSVTLEHKPRPS